MRFSTLIISIPLLFTPIVICFADPGDTTVVSTFVEEFQNWADPHIRTFEFPPPGTSYNEAWLHIELGCPGAPGDCDPWDRTARLDVRRQLTDSTSEDLEIARYITPYDITGSGRPGTCGWDYDMLEYLPLLHDSVTLVSWIESYIGGNRGWLVTATFYFVEGELPMRPYRVENLWRNGYLGIGDPADPPDDHLDEAAVALDSITSMITVRVVTTGHGQGNTRNAAEFSRLAHGVWVDDQYFEHDLWRGDCISNPCSPQGGTWQFDRAGWCPGSKVYPWDNTAINFSPGDTKYIFYVIEDYENFCRPNNPDCVSGQTCTDCNYNSTGHTAPNYNTIGQVILWTSSDVSAEPERMAPVSQFRLDQNFPNPFNPVTTIRFSIPTDAWTKLSVFDLNGRLVKTLADTKFSAGEHSVSFDGTALASGLYFYSLEIGRRAITNKMLLLK